MGARNGELTVTVGADDVKKEDATEHKINITERDPTSMNKHLMVHFEDIIAEPDSTIFSFDKIWSLSFKVFMNSKLWCYRLTTLICAIPASLLWGINFALISFCHIWCCIPCWKAYDIELLCVQKTFSTFMNTFCRPCYEAAGYVFHNIRITTVKQ